MRPLHLPSTPVPHSLFSPTSSQTHSPHPLRQSPRRQQKTYPGTVILKIVFSVVSCLLSEESSLRCLVMAFSPPTFPSQAWASCQSRPSGPNRSYWQPQFCLLFPPESTRYKVFIVTQKYWTFPLVLQHGGKVLLTVNSDFLVRAHSPSDDTWQRKITVDESANETH